MISSVTTTPTTQTTASAAGTTATDQPAPGGAMGKTEFLKLFVAQLKNQDPMNPMQGDQLAAQLAQFSSVEQLISLNDKLDTQTTSDASILDAMRTSSAVGMIGKTVMAEGNGVMIGGDGAQSVTAEIGAAGGDATLKIYDKAGNEVGSRSLGTVSAGRQTFALGSAASGLPAGQYTYGIDVKGAGNTSVDVRTFTVGKIDGVQSTANGPVLTSGPFSFAFGSIVQVEDAK